MSNDPIKLLQDSHRHLKQAEIDACDTHTSLAIVGIAKGLQALINALLTIQVHAKMSADDAAR